jgi:hypothetical protein
MGCDTTLNADYPVQWQIVLLIRSSQRRGTGQQTDTKRSLEQALDRLGVFMQ